MVLTNRMKLLMHENRKNKNAKFHQHLYSHRSKNELQAEQDAEEEVKASHNNWSYDPYGVRRRRIIDQSKEQLDSHSNLDVGTRLRHLHFGDRKFGIHEMRPINFTHIVDLDINDYKKIIITRFLHDVLASYTFRWTILGLVITNALLIGLNTYEEYRERYRISFEVLDQIILSIFVFEILLKWMYDFRAFWLVWWNILDFLIVAFVASASLLPSFIQSGIWIAIVRVVRSLRSLRSVSNLTSLIVVSHTIAKSCVDMGNILFVLLIFMVVLAIAGVVLFDDESFKTDFFLTPLDAWFVLFVCVTQDGWIEVLDSFREIGGGQFIMVSLYLILAVSIGAFVFANLIVAVVVANLESAIRSLKAEKTKNENPLLYHDEFSPNEIEIIPTYDPFKTARIPILHQRPLIAPKLTNNSMRRLQAYQTAIVALEQNLLEYSVIEHDFVRLLGVILGILRQMERHEQSVEQNASRRKEALKDLQAYTHLAIPTDAIDRANLNQKFTELKGRAASSTSIHRFL